MEAKLQEVIWEQLPYIKQVVLALRARRVSQVTLFCSSCKAFIQLASNFTMTAIQDVPWLVWAIILIVSMTFLVGAVALAYKCCVRP